MRAYGLIAPVPSASGPVQVFLDDYLAPFRPGLTARKLTIVNDTAHAILDARLVIDSGIAEDPLVHELALIPASRGLRLTLPVHLDSGRHDLRLELSWPGGTIANSYVLQVEAGEERLPARVASIG